MPSTIDYIFTPEYASIFLFYLMKTKFFKIDKYFLI